MFLVATLGVIPLGRDQTQGYSRGASMAGLCLSGVEIIKKWSLRILERMGKRGDLFSSLRMTRQSPSWTDRKLGSSKVQLDCTHSPERL